MSRLPRGELERRVLEVLWAAGDACTPREVHDAVSAERDLAYTTTMTILVRLWRKELLHREPSGRTFVYRPVEARDQRVASRMEQLLDGAGDRSAALAGFVERLPKKELEALRRLLEAGRRKR